MKQCTTYSISVISDKDGGGHPDQVLIDAVKDGLDLHAIDHEEVFIVGHEIETASTPTTLSTKSIPSEASNDSLR